MIDYRNMTGNGPTALINGCENFVAKILADELREKDINVIEVGEDGEVQYVFDFVGDERVWEKAKNDGAKLAVIRVNNLDGEYFWRKLWGREGDWRMIEVMDVFGPGMSREGWLANIFEQATKNQSIEMPAVNLELRLLAAEEAVEAILRGTLMSSTASERFVVAGEAIQGSQVLDALFYGAKMTKKGIMERMDLYKDWNKQAVEDNWNKLRWKPEGDFKSAINKTLQYFFTVIDEENRNKKNLEKKQSGTNKKFGGWEMEIERNEKQETGNWNKTEDAGSMRKEREKVEVVVSEDSGNEKQETRNWNKTEIKSNFEEKEEKEQLEREKLIEEAKRRIHEEERIRLEEIERERKIEEEKRRIREEAQRRIEEEQKKQYEELEEKEEIEEEEVVGKALKKEPEEEWKNFRVNSRLDVNTETRNEKLETRIEPVLAEVKEFKPINSERSRLKSLEKKKFKLNFKLKVNWGWWIGGMIFGGVMLMSIPGYEIWKTSRVIKRIDDYPKLLEEKKYDEASKIISKDLEYVKATEVSIDDMGLKALVPVRNYYNGLKVIEGVLELESVGLDLVNNGDKISEAIFEDKEIDWDKTTGELNKNLDNFEARAGILQARLGGDWSWLPARWRNYPHKGSEQLNKVRNMTSKVRQSMEFVPTMIGGDGKRKDYLVLLQNETELRPGGGFIGSYAILSFDSGKLTGFDVQDVYEADGQLKGHVEPPAEIKTHLGEANWYMRDANWQPNFTASAKDIQWFFEKEMGRKVDGVIGVDLAVARGILGVIGEVYVPDFKENINKDNLFEQAEFYSENKSFPGSQQKENFLGMLGKQLFEEVKGMKPVQRLKMAQELIDLLERNEIQLAMNDAKAASKITQMGWDGSLYEGRCSGDNCFTDYFYALEANLGVNKANYFIYRNIDMVVDLTPRALSRVVKINYENTAKSSSWPGGEYKNYMRVYVPASANLAQVAVYDTNDPNTKKIYSNDELKITQVGSKKEIGMLVMVPITKKRTIEIRYVNEIDLTNKDKFSYLSYIQRQPGYGQTGMVNLVSFPDGWQPMQVQPAASLVGGKLLFNQIFDRDIKMGVEISK